MAKKNQEVLKKREERKNHLRLVPDAVLPYDLCGVVLETEEDLLSLGAANLQYFRKYWRREERELRKRLNEMDEVIVALESAMTPEGKVALAAQYERPEFPVVVMTPNSHERRLRPEPQDEASRSRRDGTTTFNYCGWCKYAWGGLKRCDYYIKSKCKLLGDLLGTEANEFNTPCRVMQLSEVGLAGVVQYLRDKRTIPANDKANVVSKLHYLNWLIKQAQERKIETKPVFPRGRGEAPFAVGERVMCYFPQWDSIRPEWQRMFVAGTVVDTPYRMNGWTTVRFTKQVSTTQEGRGALDGYGMNFYSCGPRIMHMEEYKYLRDLQGNDDFRMYWMRSCLKCDEGDADDAVLDQIEDFEAVTPGMGADLV